MKPGRLLPILSLLTILSLALAISVGSTSLRVDSVLAALRGGDSVVREVILDLRLPRALNAFSTGGLLALSGALMQVLLRNPLADPYILGISGGAAVGALSAMLAGSVAFVAPAALGGAFASTVLVFALARFGAERAPWTTTRLLLTGVVVAAGWGALIALMLTLAPDAQVKGMLFWLLGDLSAVSHAWPTLLTLVFALAVALPFGRDLNLLARGEDSAS